MQHNTNTTLVFKPCLTLAVIINFQYDKRRGNEFFMISILTN